MASENTSLNAHTYSQPAHTAPGYASPNHGPPGYNTLSYHQPSQPGQNSMNAGQDMTPPLFPEDMEPYDPRYVFVEVNGKWKRQERAIPEGLTPEEVEILRKIRKHAHRLDSAFSLCGMHFGWTFFIHILPGGHLVDIILNRCLIARNAKKLEDIPKPVVKQITKNDGISFLLGCTPYVGDCALAYWKPNVRNANIVEYWLEQHAKKRSQAFQPDEFPIDKH